MHALQHDARRRCAAFITAEPHEGRWRLQLDPSTRQLTVMLPDGHIHSSSLSYRGDENTRRRRAA